jgi:hypothetical protein
MRSEQITEDTTPSGQRAEVDSKQHRFSFTGVVEGPGDLSERVDEYLQGFGEPRS